MSVFHLKVKEISLYTGVCFILILQIFHLVATTDDISHQIDKCCNIGKVLAKKQNNCDSYQYDISSISPIWRGLCHSTHAVCCSHELEKQFCLDGRLAALTGSRCYEKFNNVTAYSDCCLACQVGLAVKASGNTCNDTFFSYFADIDSFRVCCKGDKTLDQKPPNQLRSNDTNTKNPNEPSIKVIKSHESPENADGTIILRDDDDDICAKFPLCEQICENTMESYVCKCQSGYKLNDDMVTCSATTSEISSNNTLELLLSPAAQTVNDRQDNVNYDSTEEENDEGEEELVDFAEMKCPPGFDNDPMRSNNCIDVDECLLKLNDCKINQYCLNTNGSFRCLNANPYSCELGSIYNDALHKCTELETNHISRVPSALHFSNHSVESAASKTCEEGFQWKNDSCIDINECQMDDAACDSNQMCINDIGGYHCDCKIGFNLDGTTNSCIDINECSINNHNCLSTQRCDNTVGSYVCTRLQSCGTGYTLNADSNTCDDNDECSLNTHNCKDGWDCYNTKGSFRCHRRTTTTTATTTTTTTTTTTQKPPILPRISPYYDKYYNASGQNYGGYRYLSPYISQQTLSHQSNSDSIPSLEFYKKIHMPCDTGLQRNSLGVCIDVNECLLPTKPCGSHQRCINTNGSYRCQNLLKCPPGYKANPEGSDCIDTDECETGEHNCIDNQICRNRKGGFICSCPPGHHLARLPDGASSCVDINECDQRVAPLCPANAQCINTIGSYFCECKSGYQKSTENERICLDVDECNEVPGLCHQKCVNFFGGYRCTCHNGYELGLDNRTCIDVDECEVQHTHKLCMGFCNNVPGSYECSCPRGYTLASDRNTCLDINECVGREFCTGRYDVCTNKRGGYKCFTINCPYGYTNDPDQKTRCRLINNMCEGEDCYNKPSAYTYNFITFVSQMLVPPEGRTFFSLKGPDWYDNIEFDMKIVKIQAAANIEKATYNHFGTLKGHHEVNLSLKRSLEGPQEVEIDLTMTVFTRGLPRGKSVAKVIIIVSQYTF